MLPSPPQIWFIFNVHTVLIRVTGSGLEHRLSVPGNKSTAGLHSVLEKGEDLYVGKEICLCVRLSE